MFEDSNVEVRFREGVLKETGIHVQTQRDPDVDMETTLKWTVEVVMNSLEELSERNDKS